MHPAEHRYRIGGSLRGIYCRLLQPTGSIHTTQPYCEMSTQQKALFLKEKRGTFYVGTKDIPEPAAGEVLVEVHATAINPIDWKVQASYDTLPAEYPAVIGHDAAGIVKKVGEGVTNVAVGDRVYVLHFRAGSILTIFPRFYPGYFNNRQGAFQQYSIAVADLIAKVRIPLAVYETPGN